MKKHILSYLVGLLFIFLSSGAKAFSALEFDEESQGLTATRSPSSSQTVTFKSFVTDSISFNPCKASDKERNQAFERIGISPKFKGEKISCTPFSFKQEPYRNLAFLEFMSDELKGEVEVLIKKGIKEGLGSRRINEILKEKLGSKIEGETQYQTKTNWSQVKEIEQRLWIEYAKSPSKGSKNLFDADLRRADLRGVNLKGADLSHTNLKGADLTGANLTNGFFEGANLEFADLSEANLTGANLRGIKTRGLKLHYANLERVNLQGTELFFAKKSKIVSLKGANLKGINMKFILYQAQPWDLSTTDLTDADFEGANLRGRNFENVDFKNANLKDVDFAGGSVEGANFSKVKSLEGANFQGVFFSKETRMGGRNLKGANLTGVDFEGMSLKEANLTDANLERAFLHANLSKANLEAANLQGAKLRLATLEEANLTNVDLRGVKDLYTAKLQGATLDGIQIYKEDVKILEGKGMNVSNIEVVEKPIPVVKETPPKKSDTVAKKSGSGFFSMIKNNPKKTIAIGVGVGITAVMCESSAFAAAEDSYEADLHAQGLKLTEFKTGEIQISVPEGKKVNGSCAICETSDGKYIVNVIDTKEDDRALQLFDDILANK